MCGANSVGGSNSTEGRHIWVPIFDVRFCNSIKKMGDVVFDGDNIQVTVYDYRYFDSPEFGEVVSRITAYHSSRKCRYNFRDSIKLVFDHTDFVHAHALVAVANNMPVGWAVT